ncbi:chloroplast mutator family protein [Hibiscus syriacus]|uniref:Chloroplast mutator family protein n=1 Tax=Hibiscus syriacus TaxID=106335 RepID=A0A6A3CVB1_HIBSY|nr:chloroplast mutator family protein [Hibiscus syriacus]
MNSDRVRENTPGKATCGGVGVLSSLEMVRELELQNVVVEVDSKDVFKLLFKGEKMNRVSSLVPYIVRFRTHRPSRNEDVCVVWVNPKRKLTTRSDTEGHTNPTWNDKFIFRVDDEFLSSETSAVMVEIYAVHCFRDIHDGTVRIIIGNLLKTSSSHQCLEFELDMRFVALQIRKPSDQPQGILNIGLNLFDGSRRSMPLYMQMGSSPPGTNILWAKQEFKSPSWSWFRLFCVYHDCVHSECYWTLLLDECY